MQSCLTQWHPFVTRELRLVFECDLRVNGPRALFVCVQITYCTVSICLGNCDGTLYVQIWPVRQPKYCTRDTKLAVRRLWMPQSGLRLLEATLWYRQS